MTEQKRLGRPKKGHVVIKIYGPSALRDFLDFVAEQNQLPDRSAAGRLILADAVGRSAFMGIDAAIASEHEEAA